MVFLKPGQSHLLSTDCTVSTRARGQIPKLSAGCKTNYLQQAVSVKQFDCISFHCRHCQPELVFSMQSASFLLKLKCRAVGVKLWTLFETVVNRHFLRARDFEIYVVTSCVGLFCPHGAQRPVFMAAAISKRVHVTEARTKLRNVHVEANRHPQLA
jgi:hypothetical protein